MIIEQPAIYLRWLYPRALWRMDRHEKAVYLTFDDGPIPEATPFILDTLKEFDVHATFFMVGDNVRKYPELYQRILREGHQVGNHTITISAPLTALYTNTATMWSTPMHSSRADSSVRLTDGCVCCSISSFAGVIR